jgi:hypothetical protein
MARSHRSAQKQPPTFTGEIWTDARGRATVVLPSGAEALVGTLDYALEPVIGGGEARVASELAGGCFLIETDEPHVKVAWQVTGTDRP